MHESMHKYRANTSGSAIETIGKHTLGGRTNIPILLFTFCSVSQVADKGAEQSTKGKSTHDFKHDDSFHCAVYKMKQSQFVHNTLSNKWFGVDTTQ